MGLDKLSKFEPDAPPPPISGAYIRSLVKQLTNSSSRPKDTTTTTTMNTNDDTGSVVDSTIVSPSGSSRKHGNKVLGAQLTQQQQQHKKQARRRLHTSRPYQERLLNMAEARREIVTALKFHRAAMKQASEQKQQQQQEQQEVQEQKQQQQHQPSESFQLFHHTNFEQDGKFNNSRWNSRTLPSCMNNFPNNILDEFPYSSSFSHNIPLPSSVPNPYNLPVANSSSPIIAPPLVAENPNFTLPNQALGLNLNLHDFNNLDDATLFLNNNNNNNNNNNYSPLFSYSSPTPSSPPLCVVTDQEVPSIGTSQGEGGSSIMVDTIQSMATTNHVGGGGLHTAMDDEGMEEIRSLGEQYQMEWNDTMNLVTSTWWFNFLKNMEHGTAPEVKTEVDAYHNFDELMEFPAWLNPNESCLEQCSKDYFKDPTLPCMDIGDIEFEGMDEEWLS